MVARKQSLTAYGRLWGTNQEPLNGRPHRARESSGSRHNGGTVTDPGKAVFLSYASQDAEAAQRLCHALRAAGIEVWFDQSELRGGDVWDQKIRREIHDCALFIPVISANTASRHEGYFRLEWDLADQRTHMLARNRAFIVPVCLDATPDAGADVPESFQRVQWTRLPGGETRPEFVRRIEQLLSGEVRPMPAARAPAGAASGRPSRGAWLAVAVVIAAAAGFLLVEKPWGARPPPPAAFAPPPHSIAVLPFVNLSGDPSQEYFSDGLTEELLDSLSEINELQVAARTSSFSFKGTNTDIGTIARKLNVGAVLEGSVRRSEHTIRISAQMINAVTGFHLWSKTYDRDLGDVLKLQTEIATSVAGALKVTLLGDVAAKVELGGTSTPAAFDAYLRGAKAFSSVQEATKDLPGAIAAYTEAIRLDPHYALAFAGRSIALTTLAGEVATVAAAHEGYAKAQADAQEALALAPDLAQAHIALGSVSEDTLDFTQANDEYQRALALAPGSADVLRRSGTFAAYMGHVDTAISAARRAIMLDPLARASHSLLGRALYVARRYEEAAGAFAEGVSVAPDFKATYAERGLAFYGLGDLERARASCEAKPDYWFSHPCLAVIYDKLGRHADAQAELSKLTAAVGDAGAYQYATIYAQWGNRAKALEWLETALRQRDGGSIYLKTDPLLDPVRNGPHFQAIERALKFPN
jgi:TolB-like protein/tetratricopeptide (TPR) repeat protein